MDGATEQLFDEVSSLKSQLAAANSYRRMCRDHHEQIGYSSDPCPLCMAKSDLEECREGLVAARVGGKRD